MFGPMMGDLEDDPIFGHHMRSMRQMNSMMSSMFADPFGGMFGGFDPSGMMGAGPSAALTMGHHGQQQQQFHPMLPMQQQMQQHHQMQQQQQHHRNAAAMMMPFGFGMGGGGGAGPAGGMAGLNRLLMGNGMGDMGIGGGASFSSSQVISMTRGPDGRPQVYKATSSTKTGPGGVKETQKTVQDSRSGVKKMAIGHHIGERAHVIEREKNYHTGHEEERQDFINLEEDEADDFNREFSQRSRSLGGGRSTSGHGGRSDVAAIMPAPSQSSARSSPAPLAIMGPAQGQPMPSTSNPQSAPVSNLPHNQEPNDVAEVPLTSKPPTGNSRPVSTTSRRPPSKLARRPIKASSGAPAAASTPSSSTSTPSSIHPHPYGAAGSSSGASRRRVKGNSPSHHQHQPQQQQQMQFVQQQQQQQHQHIHNSQTPHHPQQQYQIIHQHTPRNGDPWIEEPL